jgi:hypothetical protein
VEKLYFADSHATKQSRGCYYGTSTESPMETELESEAVPKTSIASDVVSSPAHRHDNLNTNISATELGCQMPLMVTVASTIGEVKPLPKEEQEDDR